MYTAPWIYELANKTYSPFVLVDAIILLVIGVIAITNDKFIDFFS